MARSKKKPPEPIAAASPVSPLDALLAGLATYEAAGRAVPPGVTEAGVTQWLINGLAWLGSLGPAATAAIPTIVGFIDHAGEKRVPEETIYWDWTMDDSCKEVRPGYSIFVANVAVAALGQIGPAALPALEVLYASDCPRRRRLAIRALGDEAMAAVARRGEELARAEAARPDCLDPGGAITTLCRCRLMADPSAGAAIALIGDADPEVRLAALDLTYNGWPGLLDADRQRAAGDEFRAAILARFDDGDPRIPPKAIAALLNPNILSREVLPAVRRLSRHRDPDVRQQVGNVVAACRNLKS